MEASYTFFMNLQNTFEQYYKNHDKIRMDKNSKIKCTCGLEYSKGNKMRHYRSNFHKNNTIQSSAKNEENESSV